VDKHLAEAGCASLDEFIISFDEDFHQKKKKNPSCNSWCLGFSFAALRWRLHFVGNLLHSSLGLIVLAFWVL
jgi:hypothetical protein